MRYLALIIFLLTFAGSGLSAQKRDAKPASPQPYNQWNRLYTFSVAPGSFLISTLDAGIERRMTDRVSLLVQGRIGFRKIQLWESLGGKYFNYGGRLEYRNYAGRSTKHSGGGLQGPYFAFVIKAGQALVKATLQEKDYTMVSSKNTTPGIALGWKFPVIRRFPQVNLDIAIGGGYKFGKVNGRYAEKSRSVFFKNRGVVPSFEFRVGYMPGNAFWNNSKPGLHTTATEMAIAYHDRYSRKKRKSIEKALLQQHLDPGKVDGKFDAETIQAIRTFQNRHGMAADGKAGKETLKKLKVAAD